LKRSRVNPFPFCKLATLQNLASRHVRRCHDPISPCKNLRCDILASDPSSRNRRRFNSGSHLRSTRSNSIQASQASAMKASPPRRMTKITGCQSDCITACNVHTDHRKQKRQAQSHVCGWDCRIEVGDADLGLISAFVMFLHAQNIPAVNFAKFQGHATPFPTIRDSARYPISSTLITQPS
jgi:hypothetical protein